MSSTISLNQIPTWTRSFVQYEQNFFKDANQDQSILGRLKYKLLGRALFLTTSMSAHAEAIIAGVEVCALRGKSFFKEVDERQIKQRAQECQTAYSISLRSFYSCFKGKGNIQIIAFQSPVITQELPKEIQKESDPFVLVHVELEQNPKGDEVIHSPTTVASDQNRTLSIHTSPKLQPAAATSEPFKDYVIKNVPQITTTQYAGEGDHRVFFGSREFFAKCSPQELLTKLQESSNPLSEALSIHLVFSAALKERISDPACIVLQTGLLTPYRERFSSNGSSDFSSDREWDEKSNGSLSSSESFDVLSDHEGPVNAHNTTITIPSQEELQAPISRSSSHGSFVMVSSDEEGPVRKNSLNAAIIKEHFGKTI